MLILILSLMSYQSGGIDAMLTIPGNRMYAFVGSSYYRYNLATNQMDPGYPKPISANWPGLTFSHIDAAINWQNGKVYFFSGNLYVRFDIAANRVDPGYPQYIANAWKLPWNHVDAVIYWGSNKAYFFNNASGQFVRYDVVSNQPDPGYPKMTAAAWSPLTQISSGTQYQGKVYLNVGNYFYRMDTTSGLMEGGYPKNINLLPDVPSSSYASPVAPPPARVNPPPPQNTPPQSGNRINGTLAYNQNGYWVPWNDVQVQLQQANAWFNQRFQSYTSSGYSQKQALSELIREDNLWTTITSSTTKPAQLQNSKYGMSYSWFGFVGVGTGYYRIYVAGYPNLTRWVSLPGSGTKIDVVLEYQ